MDNIQPNQYLKNQLEILSKTCAKNPTKNKLFLYGRYNADYNMNPAIVLTMAGENYEYLKTIEVYHKTVDPDISHIAIKNRHDDENPTCAVRASFNEKGQILGLEYTTRASENRCIDKNNSQFYHHKKISPPETSYFQNTLLYLMYLGLGSLCFSESNSLILKGLLFAGIAFNSLNVVKKFKRQKELKKKYGHDLNEMPLEESLDSYQDIKVDNMNPHSLIKPIIKQDETLHDVLEEFRHLIMPYVFDKQYDSLTDMFARGTRDIFPDLKTPEITRLWMAKKEEVLSPTSVSPQPA